MYQNVSSTIGKYRTGQNNDGETGEDEMTTNFPAGQNDDYGDEDDGGMQFNGETSGNSGFKTSARGRQKFDSSDDEDDNQKTPAKNISNPLNPLAGNSSGSKFPMSTAAFANKAKQFNPLGGKILGGGSKKNETKSMSGDPLGGNPLANPLGGPSSVSKK